MRWLLLLFSASALAQNLELNVRNFGAHGDGVLDDTAIIQGVLNNAQSRSTPVRVFLPTGTYRLTAPLTITNSNVELYGNGINSTILKVTANGIAQAIYVHNPNMRLFTVDIRKLKIQGDSSLIAPPNGIEFANCSSCNIEDYYGTRLNSGIVVNGCEIMFARRFTLANNYYGIYQTAQDPNGFGYGNMWAENFVFDSNTNACVLVDGPTSKSHYAHGWMEQSQNGFLFQNRTGADAEMDGFDIRDVIYQNLVGTTFVGGKFISSKATAGSNYLITLNLAVKECRANCPGASNAVEFITAGNTHPNTANINVDFESCIFTGVTNSGIYADSTKTYGRLEGSYFVQGGAPVTSGSGLWYSDLYPPNGVPVANSNLYVMNKLAVGVSNFSGTITLPNNTFLVWRDPSNASNSIAFYADTNNNLNITAGSITRWSVMSNGTFQANGPSSITSSSGDLVAAPGSQTLTINNTLRTGFVISTNATYPLDVGALKLARTDGTGKLSPAQFGAGVTWDGLTLSFTGAGSATNVPGGDTQVIFNRTNIFSTDAPFLYDYTLKLLSAPNINVSTQANIGILRSTNTLTLGGAPIVTNLSGFTNGILPNGRYRSADESTAILLGAPAGTHGANSITLGDNLVNSAPRGLNLSSVAGSSVTGTNGINIFAGSVSGYYATAIQNADAGGDYSFAIGLGALAANTDAFAFGRNSTTTRTNQFKFGKNGVQAVVPGDALVTNAVNAQSMVVTNGLTNLSVSASSIMRTDATKKEAAATIGTGLVFDGTTLSATGIGGAGSGTAAQVGPFSGADYTLNYLTFQKVTFGSGDYQITLPSAGTYLVIASFEQPNQNTIIGEFRLYNETDMAEVAGSTRQIVSGYVNSPFQLSTLITVAGAKTISVQAHRDDGSALHFVTSTRSTMLYVRVL